MHIISECILSVINLHVIKIHIMRGANNCFQAIGGPKDIFVGGGVTVRWLFSKILLYYYLNFLKLQNFHPYLLIDASIYRVLWNRI